MNLKMISVSGLSISGILLFAQQANLLKNPGFESDLKNSWSGTNYGGGKGLVERSDENPHTGKTCLKVEKTIGPGGTMAAAAWIPVPRNREMEISFFYRTEGKCRGIYSASYFQKVGREYKPVTDILKQPYGVPNTVYKMSSRWQKVSRRVMVPSDKQTDNMYLRLAFQVWGTQDPARLFLDDVTVSPVEKAAEEKKNASENCRLKLFFPPPFKMTPMEKAAYRPMRNPHRMSIENGLLLRDGKPYFWLGNGSDLGSAQATPAGLWLARLMGNSFVACEAGGHLGANQNGNEIRFTINRPYELQGQASWHREATRLGLLTEVCSPDMPWQWSALRTLVKSNPSLGEVYGRMGHGLPTDPNSEIGLKSSEFLRASRIDHTKLISPFLYEFYREPGYEPTNNRIVQAFIAFAKRKYGDLKTANTVWKTDFKSWDEVKPPHFAVIADVAKLSQLRVWLVKNKPEMYFDWIRCLQLDLREGVGKEVAALRKHLPGVPFSLDIRGHRTYSDGYFTFDPDLFDEIVDVMFIHYQYRAYRHTAPIDLDSLNGQTTYPLFVWNYFKTNSKHPVWDCENIVHVTLNPGSSMKAMANHDLGQFHNEKWQFRMDDKKEGFDKKWFHPEFNDSGWSKMSVPGCWDRTKEFSGRSGWGWYRRSFYAKANKLDWMDGSKRFYIYGKGITQKAVIWLNGKEICRVNGFDKYQVDVGAILNFNGMNQITVFVDGNGFYNGIREYIHLLPDDQINERTVFGKKQYRAMLWTYMMRGISAASVWSWQNEDNHPYPYLAELVDEVNNVSEVVLPAMRGLQGKVAYLYAFLQGRGVLCHAEKSYNDHMNYYNAIEFSQIRPDLVSEKNFLSVTPDRYPLIVVPYAKFVFDKTYEHFKNYVKNGGTAVVTFDSLGKTFSHYAKTDIERIAGVRVLGEYKANGKMQFEGRKYTVEPGDEVGMKGVRIALNGAKALAHYTDGSSAVTENVYGKGRLVFIAPRLDFYGARAVLKKYLPESEVKIKSAEKKEFPFIEAVIAENGARAVLYLHNHGGVTHPLDVAIPAKYADYTARDVCGSFERIGKSRFRLVLPSNTPAALLLERKGVMPLVLRGKNLVREKVMKRLAELNRNGSGDRPKALFLKDDSEYVGSQTGRNLVPYLTDLLDKLGYESESLPLKEWTAENLKKFDLVLLPETNSIRMYRFNDRKQPYCKLMKEYVQNGGSLFVICYTGRTINAGGTLLKNLTPGFGVSSENQFTFSSKNSIYGDPLQYTTGNVNRQSALADGVRTVQFYASTPLKLGKTSLSPVVSTPADAEVMPGKPMIAAGEYGKGRVVIAADLLWIQPTRIEHADNAPFLANLMGYLLKKEITPQFRSVFKKTLFLTEKDLNEIENGPVQLRGNLLQNAPH